MLPHLKTKMQMQLHLSFVNTFQCEPNPQKNLISSNCFKTRLLHHFWSKWGLLVFVNLAKLLTMFFVFLYICLFLTALQPWGQLYINLSAKIDQSQMRISKLTSNWLTTKRVVKSFIQRTQIDIRTAILYRYILYEL
jgi:hypothetical protein